MIQSNYFSFCIFLSIIFFSFFLTTFAKADEMADLKKIGFQKEKVDKIYTQLLSVLDATGLIEDIITELEEGTINKKKAMTQGMQIIEKTKVSIEDVSKKLDNLEPLVLSSPDLQDLAKSYDAINIFLQNNVLPIMKEEIFTSEQAFLSALKGDFGNFLERWTKSLNKAIILLDGENEFLKISISSIDKNHPNTGMYQAVIEGNDFAKELLLGVQYLVNNLESNNENLKIYLSQLEITLGEILERSELALKKSEKDQIDMVASYENTELTEEEKDLLNRAFAAFEESRFIEVELLNSMKNLTKDFTYDNYIENENFLNDLLDGFNEISYYSTLREEAQIKQARILQSIED